jgi:predicted site-specific integrase-resolvase
MYHKEDVLCVVGIDPNSHKKKKICYARVSSRNQVDDLSRQVSFLQHHYPDHSIVTDVGSGLSWTRPGLRSILEHVVQGTVSEVVVADRDRLSRFATELIIFVLSICGCTLVVHNEKDGKVTNPIVGDEQRLVHDVISILHVYTCRLNGKRRRNIRTKTTIVHTENQAVPTSPSEGHFEKVGMCGTDDIQQGCVARTTK